MTVKELLMLVDDPHNLDKAVIIDPNEERVWLQNGDQRAELSLEGDFFTSKSDLTSFRDQIRLLAEWMKRSEE